MNTPTSRPPLARFRRIVQLVSNKPRTASSLADELEVSRKTVQRDIEFLRDRLGVDINATGHGYRISRADNLCAVCLQPVEESRTVAQRICSGPSAR